MMVYFSWKKHHSCKFHHLSVCSIHWRAGQVIVVLCHFQGPHFSSQSFKTRQTWPNKKRWHVDMPVGHANWDAILAAYHLPWWPVGFHGQFNKLQASRRRSSLPNLSRSERTDFQGGAWLSACHVPQVTVPTLSTDTWPVVMVEKSSYLYKIAWKNHQNLHKKETHPFNESPSSLLQ